MHDWYCDCAKFNRIWVTWWLGNAAGALMVDDSREVAAVTLALMEKLGYRVVRAESAADALRHLEQGIAFELVFSDIGMPDAMDWLGLANQCVSAIRICRYCCPAVLARPAAADGRFEISRKPLELGALEEALEKAIGHRQRAGMDHSAMR